MKVFEEYLTEDRRLVILRLLEVAGGYETNESIIGLTLHDFGHTRSHDGVRVDLAWLKDAGLVTIEEIATCWVAKLTQVGLETAQGIVVIPGVKRPGPR